MFMIIVIRQAVSIATNKAHITILSCVVKGKKDEPINNVFCSILFIVRTAAIVCIRHNLANPDTMQQSTWLNKISSKAKS